MACDCVKGVKRRAGSRRERERERERDYVVAEMDH